MKFLNRQFDSAYEELIRYYPRYYREVREMVAILKAHGSVTDVLEDNIEQVYNNNFINEMDEPTISRMENFLGTALNKQRTLEERRRLVKAYFVGFGSVSATMLQETIYAYTGAEVEIAFEPCDEEGNNCLYINIARGEEETIYMSDILLLLSKKIPAHIYYRADLWYKFPGIAIGGGRKRRTYWNYEYPLSGTLPDITLHGALNAIASVIDRTTTPVKSTYEQSEESGKLSGTTPEVSLMADRNNFDVAIRKDITETINTYSQTAQEGRLTGMQPIVVKAGVINEISAAAEAQVSECGIDYIYCGEEYATQS